MVIKKLGRSERDCIFSKLDDRFSVPLHASGIEVVLQI
jgi:hypothetical protein